MLPSAFHTCPPTHPPTRLPTGRVQGGRGDQGHPLRPPAQFSRATHPPTRPPTHHCVAGRVQDGGGDQGGGRCGDARTRPRARHRHQDRRLHGPGWVGARGVERCAPAWLRVAHRAVRMPNVPPRRCPRRRLQARVCAPQPRPLLHRLLLSPRCPPPAPADGYTVVPVPRPSSLHPTLTPAPPLLHRRRLQGCVCAQQPCALRHGPLPSKPPSTLPDPCRRLQDCVCGQRGLPEGAGAEVRPALPQCELYWGLPLKGLEQERGERRKPPELSGREAARRRAPARAQPAAALPALLIAC